MDTHIRTALANKSITAYLITAKEAFATPNATTQPNTEDQAVEIAHENSS